MEWKFGDYTISTDKKLLSDKKILSMLTKSYWAANRPLAVIQKSIENSICFGVYYGKEQVGFARIVSDFATMFWIADVIIDENHRGKSLGKNLVRCIVGMEEVQSLKGILETKDAHGLYEMVGFRRDANTFMRRPEPAK
jgi:GNAT superfamily N-acetyltransferase